MIKAWEAVINGLYPPACPICGKPAPYVAGVRTRVCPSCQLKLSFIKDPVCLKCGKELKDDENEYCYDCKKREHAYTQGAAVFAYNDGIKQSIYRFKYKNRREYATFYAEEIYKSKKHLIRTWNPDVIIPVPLHRLKLRKRGYNQAQLIAEELGKLLKIPVDHTYLIRKNNTKPLKELSDTDRMKNLQNAFQIVKNGVDYRKIMLIDDIYTTGSTVDECARMLFEAGAQKVYFICLCIGKGF
jgi:ComF family protein